MCAKIPTSNVRSWNALKKLLGIVSINTLRVNIRTDISTFWQNVRAYNNTVDSATGMAPAKVTDSDILAILNRMNKKKRHVRTERAHFAWGKTFIPVKKK